ncbi:serine hydrolase-like protein isoform X2 [Manduca sexta]|nr:serine hydrolase-like protein isoform X2 [Manduca sexta]
MKSNMRLPENEVSVKAPWGNIAGLTWGSPSNPPVLLCHGKLDASSGFRPLVSLLPECFYYVAIDLPGNGRSDHFPRGVRYTVIDFVPTILKVVEHFKWDNFIYIGHSLGVPIGKFFNIAYPDYITRMVEIDPVPAHHTWPTTRQGIQDWFHDYYGFYDEKKYRKFNSGPETAPKYTREKAQQLMMETRGLTKEASNNVLERVLMPAGDSLYRFTYDQRMKEVTVLPFSGELLGKIYTTTTTPTFCVVAQGMIDVGCYIEVPFVMDEKAWPNGNYSYKIVDGGHDVHINNPGCMADDISKFILAEFKSKL